MTIGCPYHELPPDQIINVEWSGRVFPRTAASLCEDVYEYNAALDDALGRLSRVTAADESS